MAKAKTSPATKKTTKKTAAKTKASNTKASKKKPTAQEIELMNETGRRKVDVAPPVERRKRRRQIDPTTCEREYTDAEVQFMHAMDEYKRASGRMFPTCSEILEDLKKLRYSQAESLSETHLHASVKLRYVLSIQDAIPNTVFYFQRTI